MKLQYIAEGTTDCPLIRIYGDESFQVLIDSFRKLSCGETNNVLVQDLEGFEAIENCSLLLVAGERDEDIKKVNQSNHFIWILTPSTWDDLAALIEPFVKFEGYRFQWLAGGEARMGELANSEIALLITTYPDGQW